MKDRSVSGLHSRRDALGLGAMSGVGLALAGSFLGAETSQARPVKWHVPPSADLSGRQARWLLGSATSSS